MKTPARHDAAYNGGGPRRPRAAEAAAGRGGARQAPAVRPAITQYMRPATMPAPVMISMCRRTMPSKRQRIGIERHEAEIAGRSDQRAADGVSEHAADRKGFGEQRDDRRRQQRKAGDEDEAEPDQDLDHALIERAGADIAELRETGPRRPRSSPPPGRRRGNRSRSRRGGRSMP